MGIIIVHVRRFLFWALIAPSLYYCFIFSQLEEVNVLGVKNVVFFLHKAASLVLPRIETDAAFLSEYVLIHGYLVEQVQQLTL